MRNCELRREITGQTPDNEQASGWARADVMIDAATRKPYLLEINTSPGMTGHSLVPMSARATGLSYEDLCVSVLATAALDNPA